MGFERPRGTRDFPPPEMERRRFYEARLRGIAAAWGYREVATPTFEHFELFEAKSGPGIVKQLYDFIDKGERHLTLRPELTAPVLRMFVNAHSAAHKPLRWFYTGPCYRYEEPQSGRFREFFQFGIEIIGADSAEADAEVVALGCHAVEAAAVPRFTVRIGHIGALRAIMSLVPQEKRAEAFRLVDKDDPKTEAFVLDAGAPATVARLVSDLANTTWHVAETKDLEAAIAEATAMVERARLPPEPESLVNDALHRVRETIDLLQRLWPGPAELDLGVARGLDYYTGMVFEIEAPDLGAEKQVLGGGAYELSSLFGGPVTPSVGFGLGFDRVLLAGRVEAPKARTVHVAGVTEKLLPVVLETARTLREAGIPCTADVNRRGPGKNMAYADAFDAPFVVLLGPRELDRGVATVRDMATGEQTEVALGAVAEHLKGRLGAG